MIECEPMQDRMPDVAHGRGAWTETEESKTIAAIVSER